MIDCPQYPREGRALFMLEEAPTRTRYTIDDALARLPGPQGERFVTLFRHGNLLVELYAPRGSDLQIPHDRDEIYVVAQGSGTFVCADSRHPFHPGDLLFVPAGLEHRFEDFTD